MSNTSIGYFGPYRLLNVVNTGQSSRLWQAYDDHKREFVGIKTLLDQFAKQKDQIQILKWEHVVGSKLSHPKLIQIREFDWYQGTPYLVMEWFSAPNLKMWINRGYAQYSPHLNTILPSMAESLQYLHSQGWVHRDVKPDNYLFHEEQGLKLIDFALAKKAVKGIGALFSMKSKIQGTASYMSPEQIQGLPPSPHADIYSLGCTFYEMLTMRPPFTGDSMSDLLKKHLSSPPPAVTLRNKNVLPAFAELLKSMMAKNPKDRPKSMQDVVEVLKRVKLFRKNPAQEDLA